VLGPLSEQGQQAKFEITTAKGAGAAWPARPAEAASAHLPEQLAQWRAERRVPAVKTRVAVPLLVPALLIELIAPPVLIVFPLRATPGESGATGVHIPTIKHSILSLMMILMILMIGLIVPATLTGLFL